MIDGLLFVLMTAPVFGDGQPVFMRDRQGPTPVNDLFLRPDHPPELPDLAVNDIRIDGDTLYVQVKNNGTRSRVPVMVTARVESAGIKSDLAKVRTDKMAKGETRWVALSGFSYKSAGTAPGVFVLADASSVSAGAHLIPSTASTFDRSASSCGTCSADADNSNNEVTVGKDAIKPGKPE
jgi:hypothetical protein